MKKGDTFERFACTAVNLSCFSKTIKKICTNFYPRSVQKINIDFFEWNKNSWSLIRKIQSGRILHLCIVLHLILFQAIDKSPFWKSYGRYCKHMNWLKKWLYFHSFPIFICVSKTENFVLQIQMLFLFWINWMIAFVIFFHELAVLFAFKAWLMLFSLQKITRIDWTHVTRKTYWFVDWKIFCSTLKNMT